MVILACSCIFSRVEHFGSPFSFSVYSSPFTSLFYLFVCSASDIVYHFKVCHLIAASLERTTDLEACRALLEFLVTLVDKNG